MHDSQVCQDVQNLADANQKVLQQLYVVSQVFVKAAMLHHVDALSFEEFALHIEEELVHR